jgi:hypothetical protein
MRSADDWSRIKEAQRVAHDRRAVEAAQRDARVRVNATPETLRKLERSTIDLLLSRGAIGDEQYRAGREIARVWLAITAALFPRVSNPSRGARGAGVTDWSAGLNTAYGDRYIPWRAEAGAQPCGFRRTVADLVFLLVVDNYGVRQVARLWGMDQRRVLHLGRCSLWRYAEIAGWIDLPPAPPDAPTASLGELSDLTLPTFQP